MKTVFRKLDEIEKTEASNNIMCRNLFPSTSSDSVIYVGSYKLNEKYSLIDLTKSTSSISNVELFNESQHSHLPNYHSLYTNFFQSYELPSTASTSRLLDSTEGPKLSLKKHSSLTAMNDQQLNGIKNSRFSNGMCPLNKKEPLCMNQITELQEEDQNIIRHSLEIEDDINVMDVCFPQNVMNSNITVETLMSTYQVDGNDQFL